MPLASIETQLGLARTRGLLEIDAERIRPSEQGRRFLNDLLEIFLAK
jgi:coproporphyrinogen III oxidase-like Fe-S oxidoreductase